MPSPPAFARTGNPVVALIKVAISPAVAVGDPEAPRFKYTLIAEPTIPTVVFVTAVPAPASTNRIVIALLIATGWILSAQTPGKAHTLLTVAAAILVWRTRVHLLVMIAFGGLVGALGWI